MKDLSNPKFKICGFHLAVDVGGGRADAPVFPMAEGEVVFADIVVGYTIFVQHQLPPGDPAGPYVVSVYYHLKRPKDGGIRWKKGDRVSPENVLGYISPKPEDHGWTKPHLHFGIRSSTYNGGPTARVPVDLFDRDPRTEKWFYPGYTNIYRSKVLQCNPDDQNQKQIHDSVKSEWLPPLAFVSERESVNLPPVALFSIPSSLVAGANISFDASGSSIGDATYTWDFGDKTPKVTTKSLTITHTYEDAGGVTVTLTVSNSAGTSTVTKDIIIKPPAAQLTLGPTALEFGDVTLQSCGTGQFSIQHAVGTAPTFATPSTSPNPPFDIVNGASFSLSNGAAASVTVRFCPTSTGPSSGTATVTSDANFTNTNTVALSGNGVALNRLRLVSTYVGGSGFDSICCVVIHPATGDVYVAGSTSSSNFPGVSGGAQDTFPFFANSMAFIARLNANLTTLLGATYLGGTGVFTGAAAFGGENAATALAVHPATGDIYVTGTTASPLFPGTAGGAQPTIAGNGDGFVARLTADLRTLVQATYFGGSNYDQPTSIAVHASSREIYVAGTTQSTNLAGTAGGAQPAAGGGFFDGFVVRLDETLTALRQTTYLGGQLDELIRALAIHPATGDVYVTGRTTSLDFPGTVGGAQPTSPSRSSFSDGFVTRLNSDLSSILQSTYLGGSTGNDSTGIAIHPASGEVYVVGSTNSTDFPGIGAGALLSGEAGYVVRLPADLKTLLKTAPLSGSQGVFPSAITIHPTSGDVYVEGDTASPDLPGTSGSVQPGLGGPGDAFIARFSADLRLIGTTYLGGGGGESGAGLAINPARGALYVAGTTDSTDFPNTAGGAQPANAGGNDGFVATIPDTLARTGGFVEAPPD